MSPASLFRSRFSAAALHVLVGIGVFFTWRWVGLPLPGVWGRLIPLVWVLSAIVHPTRPFRRTTAYLLVVFLLGSVLWAVAEPLRYVAIASSVCALLPALVDTAGTKWGLARAMLPLLPLIVLCVPFTGDEPHYAALSESIVVDGDLDDTNNLHYQDRFAIAKPAISRLEGNVSHHQPLYAVLLIPGLLGSIEGLRLVSLVIALLASLAILRALRALGMEGSEKLVLLGLILFPGLGITGLLYPGWAAAGLLGLAAWKGSGKGMVGLLWTAVAALLLAALKLRFLPLAAGILLARLFVASRTERTVLISAAVVGFAAVLALDRLVLGGKFFWIRYGSPDTIKILVYNLWVRAPRVLGAPLASLLDVESGLLWKAPWVLAGLAGLWGMWKKHRRALIWLGLPTLLYLAAIFWWMPKRWHAMPTPAGRFFVPCVPLLLAGLHMTVRRDGTKVLLALSVMLASVYIVVPEWRFNTADGTDVLIQGLLGHDGPAGQLFPSVVRFRPLPFVLWSLFFLLLGVWRNRGAVLATVLLGAGVLGIMGGGRTTFFEMEDLRPRNRIGCSLYPPSPDPQYRNLWLGSQERMLRVGHQRDTVVLPLPWYEDAESLRVETGLRPVGDEPIELIATADDLERRIHLCSRRAPVSPWITSQEKRDRMNRQRTPDRYLDTLVVVTVPCRAGSLRLSIPRTLELPEGLYMDYLRIEPFP